MHRLELAGKASCAVDQVVQGSGALGLDHRQPGQPRGQANLQQLLKALAQGRYIGKITPGNDDMVRHLPVHRLRQLERGRFLAFQTVWVDRVQQKHRGALDHLGQHPDAAVEVGPQLQRVCAVVHGLRQLAPGNLAFRNQHQRTHTGARGIGGHGGGGVAGGRAGDPRKAFLVRHGKRGGHAGVLEGPGRVHALVLAVQALVPQLARAVPQVKQRGISFAQGHDFRRVVDNRQQVAKAPHTALVDSRGGKPAGSPAVPQGAGQAVSSWKLCRACCQKGVAHREQIAARRASEVAFQGAGRRERSTTGAVQFVRSRRGRPLTRDCGALGEKTHSC